MAEKLTQGTWAAPGRVNLMGEHTDYNGGFVLPFALSQTTTVAAAVRDDRRVTVRSSRDDADQSGSEGSGEDQSSADQPSADQSGADQSDATVEFGLDDLAPGEVQGWASYVAGTLWALEQAGYQVPGLDLRVDSTVPVGAGLSSSAALECAVGLAAAELGGHRIDRLELAGLAQRAENDFVGMPCGIMDQVASLTGEQGHAVLLDTRSLEVEQVPFALEEAGLSLMVIDSRAEHRLVDGEYAARRRQCEQGARLLGLQSLRELNDAGTTAEQLASQLEGLTEDEAVLRRLRHVLTENDRVLAARDALRAGRPADLGVILTSSHVSQRDDFQITVPETDTMVEALLERGALGARQVGGGFGGCVIALAASQDVPELLEAAEANARDREYSRPLALTAHPSSGARRSTA